MRTRTRRHLVHLLFLGPLLLLPCRTASASELTLDTSYDSTLLFGTAPASGEFGVLGLRLNDVDVEPEITGLAKFATGPLLSLDVDPGEGDISPASATYRYAPGTFVLHAEWMNDDGVLLHGRYVAPLLDFVILTCEPCGPDENDPNDATGTFTATLGAGRFDSTLSSVLDLDRRASTGTFGGYLDIITGNPDSTTRFAGSPGPWDVSVEVTLPEPGVGALTIVGGLVLWIARKRAFQSPEA